MTKALNLFFINYAFTFVARGLPDPQLLGSFDAYVGTISLNGQVYLVNLGRSEQFEQEPTWSGTRIISVNPFLTSGNSVTIAHLTAKLVLGLIQYWVAWFHNVGGNKVGIRQYKAEMNLCFCG